LRAQIPFSGCRAGYRQKGDPGEDTIRTIAPKFSLESWL
jgi:hypothetical protein